jgi:hypothetical protein
MAGQIKKIIDTIVATRAKGNPVIESTTRTKLSIKGVNPSLYTSTSADDPEVIHKLNEIANEMGISL